MATPSSPTDMEVTEGEQASCSSSYTPTNISMGTSDFPKASPIPASRFTIASRDSDEEEEVSLVWIRDAKVSMEYEFETLDKTFGWPQAYLEVSDQCYDYSSRVGRTPENQSRNRYRDVSPYDHSRVRLRAATKAPGGGFHPGLGLALAMAGSSYSFSSTSSNVWGKGRDGDGYVHNDYINASFVVVEEAERNYILTQGPLPNTCGHFWLMVWQQESKTVIMLNRFVKNKYSKCCQYWPPRQGQTLLFDEIGISVHMLREDVSPHYTIHYLRLENMLTGDAKVISHFQYTSWPNHGVPESPTDFLDFLFMMWDSGSLNYAQGPVVIHCSAGIGLSGTFALIDTCLALMQTREKPFFLNIRQVLVRMRKYRMGLIQNPEQLRFSYMAIIAGAKFLLGREKVKKRWKDLGSLRQGPRYCYDSPPQRYKEYRLTLEKDKAETDDQFSGLRTKMEDSGEGTSLGTLLT